AVVEGASRTAMPRLLAMLCILAVFVSSFFMQGAARSLFVPLSLAVGFSMLASYVLSSTFVPVLSVWLLRQKHGRNSGNGSTRFDRLRERYEKVLGRLMGARWRLIFAYVAVCLVIIVAGGLWLGRDIFPVVDAGQFRLRLRAPDGTNIGRTEEYAKQ